MVPEQLISLYKKVYKNSKKKALSFELATGKELKFYRNNFIRQTKREVQVCHQDELFQKLKSSDIIYLGDFHTLDQSSKNLERIIKFLLKENIKIKLGLEIIHQQNELQLMAYLENLITELEFLEEIQYINSWQFPWCNLQPIFKLAKNNKIPIIPLNCEGNLKVRDNFAAEQISKHLENGEEKIIVFYGEYHLTKNKIPSFVREIAATHEDLIIHQNIDSIYWKMIDKHQVFNGETIVKFNDNEFSLQTTPPWIKYESLNQWYENIIDDPDYDVHQYILENQGLPLNENNYDNFFLFTKEIMNTLNMGQIEDTLLHDFTLYDHKQINQVTLFFENKNIPQKLKRFYLKLIENNIFFSATDYNLFYCPQYSFNKMTYMSGIFYHSQLKKKIKGPIKNSYSNKALFYIFIEQAFWGYIGAKIFNHARKCDLYGDLARKTKSKKLQAIEVKNIKKALQILDEPVDNIENTYPLNHFFTMGKMIGHLLAESFIEQIQNEYKNLINVPKRQIHQLIFLSDNFWECKNELLSKIDYKNKFKSFF